MALRHSVGDLAGTVLSMLRTRLELFSLEAADEKSRLIRILCMAFGALLLMSLALLAFSIAVALYFWPTEARYLAIGTLALIYALIGLGLFWGVWNGLTKGPAPFSATLDELKRDIALADRLREPSKKRHQIGGDMAKRVSDTQLRSVKIELLRARAALERQSLGNSLRHVRQDLTPSSLVRSFLPSGVTGSRPSDWLLQGMGLMRRYPFLVSAVSTLFSGVRKKHRWLRLGAGLLLSWQLARKMGDKEDAAKNRSTWPV